MILILHGENTTAAYARLNELIAKYDTHTKLHQETNTVEDLINNISTEDLIGTKKIVVAQNFITKYRLKPQHLENITASTILVLSEAKELTKSQVNSFAKHAQIEVFKLPPSIYYFLDAITGPASNAIKLLDKIDANQNMFLVYQVLNRLFMLTVAKMNLDNSSISKIMGRALPAWQWQKIREQAGKIDAQKLNTLFTSGLKIDYMIKSGATNIQPKTLISLMLLRNLSI